MFVVGPKLINTTRNCEANSFKDWMRECSGRMITIERRRKIFNRLKGCLGRFRGEVNKHHYKVEEDFVAWLLYY